MCCKRLAGNTGGKNDAKIAIWAPSHNFDLGGNSTLVGHVKSSFFFYFCQRGLAFAPVCPFVCPRDCWKTLSVTFMHYVGRRSLYLKQLTIDLEPDTAITNDKCSMSISNQLQIRYKKTQIMLPRIILAFSKFRHRGAPIFPSPFASAFHQIWLMQMCVHRSCENAGQGFDGETCRQKVWGKHNVLSVRASVPFSNYCYT